MNAELPSMARGPWLLGDSFTITQCTPVNQTDQPLRTEHLQTIHEQASAVAVTTGSLRFAVWSVEGGVVGDDESFGRSGSDDIAWSADAGLWGKNLAGNPGIAGAGAAPFPRSRRDACIAVISVAFSSGTGSKSSRTSTRPKRMVWPCVTPLWA